MSYIDASGKYHKENIALSDTLPAPTSVWKQADHDRQRADHKQDLIRPYNLDGTPSQEFIAAYPLESQEVYKFIPTDEQLSKEQ